MPMSKSFRGRLFPRLPDIIGQFGTPFHIYDVAGILETGCRMNRAFKHTLYRNYYAAKALPNPNIMKILFEKLGFGFDCSSIPELDLSRGVGAIGESIMFTSNNTSEEEFDYSAEAGACILNLDDISLISEVPEPFPDLICFRINPGNAAVTGDNVIGKPINAKYGITLKQVVPAYRAAIERGAKRFGLHTMLCSNDLRASHMVQTVEMLLGLCVTLKQKLGIECEFINMGGGFGIPYRPSQKELSLEWMADQIVRKLEQFEISYGWRPKLFSECGRYVTGPHGVLVSRAINEKRTYKRYLGIDAGMPALMRPGMYGAYHHVDILNPMGEPRGGKRQRMSVVYSICENCDQSATNRLLPKSAKKGDIVVVHDTGAHGIAMGFNYNGRTRPQELMMLPKGEIVRIRNAETKEDLFRNIVFPLGFSYPQ